MGFLYQLIQNAITAYTLILVAYALLSWFPGAYQTAFGRWLEKLSHPYLKLFYPLNLRLGMMDFTTFERNFDMMPPVDTNFTGSQPTSRPEAPKTSSFGEWDLRRDNIVRPVSENQGLSVEKFNGTDDFDSDEELDTPPFFRNR